MTMEMKKNAAETVIRIVGRLDTITAPNLDKIINEELGIDRANIYIKYEVADHWGWNGNNF